MEFKKSDYLFEQAKEIIPGGVNSPVRAFGSVGRNPVFIRRAKGSYLYDVDGNKYIDYISSWGPMILGHCDEGLNRVATEALGEGISYGVPSEVELEMAERIVGAYRGIDMVRMVNSGTEATMSAIRVARAYTGRNKIIKFEGCYHGHSDALLVKSGSGALTFNVPTSPGVPEDTIKHTLVCRFNDIESVRKEVERHGSDIACVIIEPVPGNMGVVTPKTGFLRALRELTSKEGIVLIFDEVITGFRLSYGGAAELFGIVPDMVCFGKIIGGGLPVGAYAGKREIMEQVSPSGSVYQAGTLSGNPLAMKMGCHVLDRLKGNSEVYRSLTDKAKKLEEGFQRNIEKCGIKARVNRYHSMLSLFFTDKKIDSYESVMTSDVKLYADYFRAMLEEGILLPPAQFEAMFMNITLTDEDIERTLESNLKVMLALVDR